jgi:ketosteroid isomerase-like protein
MSEESATPDLAATMRQFADALDRRDFGALMSFYQPSAVLASSGDSSFEGAADIREFWEDMYAPFEERNSEIVDVVELGGGVLLTVVDMSARPAGSSGVIRMCLATVWVLTEGLIERQTNYSDIEEARAAAERLAQERA